MPGCGQPGTLYVTAPIAGSDPYCEPCADRVCALVRDILKGLHKVKANA